MPPINSMKKNEQQSVDSQKVLVDETSRVLGINILKARQALSYISGKTGIGIPMQNIVKVEPAGADALALVEKGGNRWVYRDDGKTITVANLGSGTIRRFEV